MSETIRPRLGVIGTGYVGLVTATCFAHLGFVVHAIDNDRRKIEKLKQGIMPVYEQNLAILVAESQTQNRLFFSTDLSMMVNFADTIFVAVGTPPQAGGAVDLSFLQSVAASLAPLLTEHRYIIIKSTVPVGTGQQFATWLRAKNPKAQFTMVSNPEFLREGMAIADFLQPDRVIIGVESKAARQHMAAVYAPLSTRGIPILFTDIASAELIKYASNGFLATKIAFINEMASLCQRVGANIEHIIQGMGTDKRIGPGYLQPGPGFGGSCFPKDTLALEHIGKSNGMPLTVTEGVIASNKQHKQRMVNMIFDIVGPVRQKRLAIWGLAFKAGTDDTRESAAVYIIEALRKAGARMQVVDPIVKPDKWALSTKGMKWCDTCEASIKNADAVIIMTEWEMFRTIDWKNLPITIPVIDFRNLYSPEAMAHAGITYYSLGRPSSLSKRFFNITQFIRES